MEVEESFDENACYYRPEENTKANSKCKSVYDIALCSLVRLVFLVQSSFCIYYLVSFQKNYVYLSLSFGLIVFIADTIYIIVRRKGKEHMW